MIVTLIICLTVVFCVVWITLWIKHMVVRNLPLFTYGECVWKDDTPDTPKHPVGFVSEPEEENDKKTTKQEQKDALLSDPTTLITALLRGEVDIDDVNN